MEDSKREDWELIHGTDPMLQALHEQKITANALAKKLKSELNARTFKAFKGDDDNILYSKSMIDWPTRQKARMDAHKLLAQYPAEKRELSGEGGGPVIIKMNIPKDDK